MFEWWAKKGRTGATTKWGGSRAPVSERSWYELRTSDKLWRETMDAFAVSGFSVEQLKDIYAVQGWKGVQARVGLPNPSRVYVLLREFRIPTRSENDWAADRRRLIVDEHLGRSNK